MQIWPNMCVPVPSSRTLFPAEDHWYLHILDISSHCIGAIVPRILPWIRAINPNIALNRTAWHDWQIASSVPRRICRDRTPSSGFFGAGCCSGCDRTETWIIDAMGFVMGLEGVRRDWVHGLEWVSGSNRYLLLLSFISILAWGVQIHLDHSKYFRYYSWYEVQIKRTFMEFLVEGVYQNEFDLSLIVYLIIFGLQLWYFE